MNFLGMGVDSVAEEDAGGNFFAKWERWKKKEKKKLKSFN